MQRDEVYCHLVVFNKYTAVPVRVIIVGLPLAQMDIPTTIHGVLMDDPIELAELAVQSAFPRPLPFKTFRDAAPRPRPPPPPNRLSVTKDMVVLPVMISTITLITPGQRSNAQGPFGTKMMMFPVGDI